MKSALHYWPQWLAGLIVALVATSMGMASGWTSPYLAQLTSEESVMKISNDEASWVASLLPLGRLLGAIIGSTFVEYLGSKSSLTVAGIPLIIGWICISFADSIIWLYIARIALGAAMGMIFACFPLYIGEISAPSIRGGMVGLVVNGLPLGTLIGNIMGPYISMMWFGIISFVLTASFMAIFPFLPQSPHYYAQRNDMTKAEAVLKWYCRKPDISTELSSVEKFMKASKTLTFRERLSHIMEPKNRRAFTVVTLLFTFMQLSGLNTIVFYMEIILRRAELTIIPPSTVVIIVNTACILVGWISMYAVDHCGRRMLLAVSSASVTLSMALLGLHFELLDRGFEAENLQWLPIVALMIYPVMCIGFIPIPSTLLGELFPADLKSVAGFVASMTSALLAFAASKTYQPLVDITSDQYVFWMYGFVMVVCCIYSITAVPETKGKTLQEIQEMLSNESPSRSQRSQQSGVQRY